jgi:adenosine deaminase
MVVGVLACYCARYPNAERERARPRTCAVAPLRRIVGGVPLDVATVDKVELHCHIDGLLDPPMLRDLRADGHDFGLAPETLEARYPFSSMERWTHGYYEFVAPYLEPRHERMPLVFAQHLGRLRRQRVVYAEVFVSSLLFAFEDVGRVVELFRLLRHIADGAGFPVELVVCIGRGTPKKLETQFPRIMELRRAGLVRGIAIAGQEVGIPIAPLRSYFERFRDSGMGIEIHAGEQGGPESVRDALDNGFPTRLGHGLAVFRDPALLDEVRRREIHLELCPTSNLRLGVVRSIDEHPLGRARELGLEFSINTDDPGPFGCSITSEYQLAQRVFGFGADDFARVRASATKAAFAGR